MAKRLVTVCDLADASCDGVIDTFRFWREGDKEAQGIDLCVSHAAPLLGLLGHAHAVDLPVKQRQTMHVTKLRTTDATRHLKKE